MATKKVQINKVVKDQLPGYIKDESPLSGEFLSAYYQGQEYQGGPIDIINNLDEYIKLNKATNLVGLTTLANPVSSTDTEISVQSTSGFPDSYGLIKINDEIITYTGIGTTAFTGCIRGFSGITSFTNPDEPEEFLFSTSKASAHAVGIGTSSGQVENLSVLFIKEFLKKTKRQFLPGFQKDLNTGLNEPQFIRHSKDFYNSRGTEESFKILFKSLYNENVDILKPADSVIAPSDANFRKTRDIIVEPIQGDPQDLVNMTLFQDPFENISKAYGPVSMVERIRVGLLTDTYYKISVDASFGSGGSTELLYGNFAIHGNTKAVGEVGVAQTYIDVDSTLGFPDKGALTFKYKNGTTGIATYSSTSITQFLGVTGITTTIKNTELIKQNTYAYGLGKADTNAGVTTDGIRVRITGVLSDLAPTTTNYQKKGAKIKLKSLGKVAVSTDFKSNNWIYNISPRYDIEEITLQDASNNTYEVETKDFHRIRIGDLLTINTKDSSLTGTYSVTDVLSTTKFRCRGAAISSLAACISVTKTITKPNSSDHTHLNNYTANVQNVYIDEVGYAHTESTTKNLVASNSLPSFNDADLDPSTQKITLSGTFLGGDTIIGITTGTKDHNFFTGDAIYYTPQKAANGTISSLLFSEGLYFVERINHNDIKLAKSASNLYDGNYQKINEDTVDRTITNNIFEKYDFHNRQILPQKLLKEIDIPVYDGKKYETTIGYNGILINGVEVLSYKSKNLCYYGTLDSIDVAGGGRYYDVINPPLLAINDGGIGYGATGYVSTRGSFQEIRVLDPGFDYTEVPIISISGGNGKGAEAECKLSTVPHEVIFNAGTLSQTVAIATDVIYDNPGYNVGFLTYHKFRNNERVVYDTFGEKALAGLDTGATYFINTQQRYDVTGLTTITSWTGYAGTTWYSNKTVRLHTDLNECIAGVNTVSISGFGEGNHVLRSLNGKAQVTTIEVTNPGEGYENKQKTCAIAGINTALDIITIKNHDYKTGEIIEYSADANGTAIEGLDSNKQYYVKVLDENSFKLSTVGVGTTAKDFYFKTKQYQNLRSVGVATHTFNYPPIKVEITGAVGISSIEGNEFKCIPQPLVRGEVTSIHLTDTGVGYGSSEILNFNRQPNIDLYTGKDGELLPVVANGEIIDVAINNRGQSYNTPPSISVAGVGTGAELIPEIVNGQLVSVKINKKGVGYASSTTVLTVESAGEFGNFIGNIQTWQVNGVQKNYANIEGSDTFLEKPTKTSNGLQCSYAYAPRSLRKVIYQNDANANALHGTKDLSLLNGNTEEDKSQHSPIIGWAYDGNPIYGPYGYEKSTGGNITQLQSGYSVDLKTNRPPTSIFPQEFFVEDFTWNSNTNEKYLDENNGRYGITPEYPKGTYAYYATLETDLTSGNLASGAADPFDNYKRPQFPYLIGKYYDAQPNEFNTLSKNNQDEIDLNKLTWVRNTEPYELLQDTSYYDYVSQSYKYITQDSVVKYAEEGSIDKVGIVTGGSSYRVGDKLVFEEKVADNFQSVAKVAKLDGVGIGTISVANTKLNNIEFYPMGGKRFIGVHTTPVSLVNNDQVFVSGISTTSSNLGGNYNIGISSAKLIVSEALGAISATGIVTFIKVQGSLKNPNDPLNTLAIRENDILKVGIGTLQEEVKVLKVDKESNRLRILRQYNDTTGIAHTIRTVIEEDPRKFTIPVGFDTTFNNRVEEEYYFDPRESVGLSTQSENNNVGIGTTVTFENPGSGISQIFIPGRSIYLPNHKLRTGDEVTYKRNTGDSIGIATHADSAGAVNPYTTNLPEGTPLFVSRLSPDFIGLSTVKVAIGTEGDQTASDIFVGTAATTRHQTLMYFLGIGTGRYHSLTTKYSNTVSGSAEKNLITVSAAGTHGLSHDDRVYLTVDAGISTTIPIKYNKANRKLVARSLDFTAAGITTAASITDIPSSIEISNHELVTGQRVIHTSSTPASGLINDEEYFVYVQTKDVIQLCGSRFQTIQKKPKFVDIVGINTGTLNLVNPSLDFYKNSTVTFDLSDPSLKYTVGVTDYPAFDLEVYTDSNFIHEYTSNEMEETFEVTRSGTVGQDGQLQLKINQYTPKILYYNLVANTATQNPDINKEMVLDTELEGNNTLNVKESRYAGTFNILANSDRTFTYDLPKYPEVASYTIDSDTKLEYTTDSKTAYGPINYVSLADKGRGYTRLPGITTVTTNSGSGAILEASSKTIGKIKTTEIQNIGFDYPSDFTLRPQAKLPQIIKIEALSGLESVGITSYGRGYNTPPALVVLDGVTRQKIDDVELSYNLATPDAPGYVDIIQNTFGLSNVTPFIVPVNNPNGVRASNFVYDSSTNTVAVTLKTAYSFGSAEPKAVGDDSKFPLVVGDKIFVENVSVGVGSTGKGFDSQYYDYQSFEITEVHENLGNVGVVTYSLGNLLPSGEVPGNFNSALSYGTLSLERDFPQFAPKLRVNQFNANETLKSETSTGPVQGVAYEYDPESKWLTVETNSDFEVGRLIESLETGAKGNVSEIVMTFDDHYKTDYFSIVDNGWEYNTGFLNDTIQRVHDNEYYQSFSYAVKSRVFFEKWKDIVNTMTHTSGFRKFSQLQVESQLPVGNQTDLRVGLAGTVTGIINIQNYENYWRYNNFDLATENLKDRDPAAGNFSDEITFQNRILIDYAESVGNRVLKIDDLSPLFNSNPRSEPWSEVARYDITNNKENRFIVYVRDRLFKKERQIMMVNALFDPVSGKSMLNQYGSVDTVLDLGSFDTAVDGTDAVLQFHPIKAEKNNYNVVTLSYNLDELGFTTSLTAIGATSIGSDSNPAGALVSIGSSNVLATGGTEIKIATVGTASTTGLGTAGNATNELYNPRSAKIIVAIATSEGSVEYDELSILYSGIGNTSIVWQEYGQLAIHNRRDNLAAQPLGTFRPYVVGVGTTAAIEVGYTPNAGIQTAWINSITIGISSESFSGVGTQSLTNASLIAKSTTIPSAGSPSAVGIGSYNDDHDGAYVLVQVKDTTNDRYEFSEVMMVDDDDDVFLTEYGNLQAGSGAFDGLGTISGRRSGDGKCNAELTITAPANTALEVKTFVQALKVEESSSDPKLIELNSGSVRSTWDVYGGTFYDKKTEFEIAHSGNPIFKKDFDGTSTTIVDLTNNTISLPNHYFVSGEEVEYTVKTRVSCSATTGIGTTGDAIGIAATFFPGIGATITYLPKQVYVVKKDANNIQLATSPADALKTTPTVVDLASVGIGTSHSITSKYGTENTRGLITIDNIIQAPIQETKITSGLSTDLAEYGDTLYATGITSFYSGDIVRIDHEIMKVDSVGFGSTNAIKVNRHWMGTEMKFHGIGNTITKLNGNYNIIKNTLNFSEAPQGTEPPVGYSTAHPNERDWVGITTGSSFNGRIFMRSGVKGSDYDAYTTNYQIDDLTNEFNGQTKQFDLKVNGSNITGIATQNGIHLVNGILQGAGELNDYTLTQVSGITSMIYTGVGASVAWDVNNASVPRGGVIISVGSSEGIGYQPLVSAGATIRFASSGIVTAVAIGNSGSGYRVTPGAVGFGSTASIGGVGIATVVKVGVALSTTGTPTIQYIGTAAVLNGGVVSIAITYTDPVPGFPGTASSTFEAIIDAPLPYQDIPLWYDTSSAAGVGTQARANITVGVATTGGRVIDFEITNLGYGYGAGQVLTVPTNLMTGSATHESQTVGIPVNQGIYKPFKLTLDRVYHDEFSMWTMGEFDVLDDFSNLFDGVRKAFPITVGGESYAIQTKSGSPIEIDQTIILTINDILQVPGEGFTFNGGATITMTEAPKDGDKMRMFFYRGTGGEDVKDRDIVETVKRGDDLVLSYDKAYNTREFVENERTVVEVKSSDAVDTNPYVGVGLGDDATEVRPIAWIKQTEDKFIDGEIQRKDRPLQEPMIFPTAYLIQGVGIGSTTLWVDNCKPFFDPENENPVDRSFQKNIQIVNASSTYEFLAGAAATAVVSVANTISSIAISTGGRGYSGTPTVSIQTPVGVGGTPLAGIGTTARAVATATLTDGVVSAITVTSPGLAYTSGKPPQVIISSPDYVREENTIISYNGDYGIVSGVGIVTNIAGIGITYGIAFDMWIPDESPLRNSAIVTPDPISVSGLTTGHYFIINNSNLGAGLTTLDAAGNTIGIGTTALDGIYQVAHYVGLSTVGFGSTVPGTNNLRRVFTSVERWEGLEATVGYSTLGQGISSSFIGEYSWGRIQLSDRMISTSYTINTNNGVIGFTTGPQVKRRDKLKSTNYVV